MIAKIPESPAGSTTEVLSTLQFYQHLSRAAVLATVRTLVAIAGTRGENVGTKRFDDVIEELNTGSSSVSAAML